MALKEIRNKRPASMAAQRDGNYMTMRARYEIVARNLFIEKGGKVVREAPHYMVVEACHWLKS